MLCIVAMWGTAQNGTKTRSLGVCKHVALSSAWVTRVVYLPVAPLTGTIRTKNQVWEQERTTND